MFTTIIQLFLTICTCGTVYFALTIWIQDRRENREFAREHAAKLYADSALMDAIMKGDYNNATLADLKNDREFLRISYLA